MTDEPKKPQQHKLRGHTEHLADEPLSGDAIQPKQPTIVQQRRVLGAGATQVLREFADAAQARGPQPPKSAKVPIPDWQTNRTGIPVSRLEDDQ